MPTQVTTSMIANNTTADVSSSAHGYAPKSPSPPDGTKFLCGTSPATWVVPPGGTSRIPFVAFGTMHSNSAGTQGDLVCDSGFLFVCVGTNSWQRIAYTPGAF